MWLKVRKYRRIFPLPKTCAENYPEIENPVNRNKKKSMLFIPLQVKKITTIIRINPKKKMIQLIYNVLNTFNM